MAALAAIRHRGPDDYGHATVQLGRQWLSVAHSRLAILDVSESGRQPMVRGPLPAGARGTRVPGDALHGEDGTGLVYNGEIYNFPELHSDLARGAAPQEFRSRCDTEMILHGVAREGLDFVQRLRGMFAFALWEPGTARLHLVRDRLGIKPLYYAQAGEHFVFGSEVRALLATGLIPRAVDPLGLESYLSFGACQDPHTLVESVHALEPSHTLTLESGRVRARRRYWQLPVRVDPSITPREAEDETRRLVRDSVERHLLSDVRVGTFLSGGVDSSIIAALMANAQRGPQHAITVVSDDGGEESRREADFASILTSRLGLQHHVVHLTASVAEPETRRAVEMMDQPSIDGPNTFVVSGAAREAGCVVALSGLGADEVFNGYSSFRTLPQLRRLTRIAGVASVGRMLAERLPPTSVRGTKLAAMLGVGGDLATLVSLQRALFLSEFRSSLVRPAFRPPRGTLLPSVLAAEELPDDPLNFISACELRGYLQNMLLRDSDCMSMAHGLELRVPFLDHKLIEFALSLPGHFRSNLFERKSLLRHAMKPLLPPAIYRRRKQGFNLAFPQWMRTSLRPSLEAALLRDNPVLERTPVAQLWQAFVSGADDRLWTRVWGLYTLTNWMNRHIFGTESVPVSASSVLRPRGAVYELRGTVTQA
jgi:asparagine synthase (glutamine-hydrolysing)